MARPLLQMIERMDSRDRKLREHCEEVGELAAEIGRRLWLPESMVARLRLAGILHDIGKVVIADAILQKPGPLDENEWEEIRQHPSTGYRLLKSVGLQELATWVHCHHERPDGTGYPLGVKRDEIPLGGAILSAADAFHAMTTDRPYQRPLTPREALAELERCSGTQFVPEVVAALSRCLPKRSLLAPI